MDDRADAAGADPVPPCDATLAAVKAWHVRRAVAYVGGNRTVAARILGVDRKTLWRMLLPAAALLLAVACPSLALDANKVDVRAAFGRPTGTFAVRVRNCSVHRENGTSHPGPAEDVMVCQAGRGCVIDLGAGDCVTASVGDERHTFVAQ